MMSGDSCRCQGQCGAIGDRSVPVGTGPSCGSVISSGLFVRSPRSSLPLRSVASPESCELLMRSSAVSAPGSVDQYDPSQFRMTDVNPNGLSVFCFEKPALSANFRDNQQILWISLGTTC